MRVRKPALALATVKTRGLGADCSEVTLKWQGHAGPGQSSVANWSATVRYEVGVFEASLQSRLTCRAADSKACLPRDRGQRREEVEKLAFRVLIGPLKFAQRTKADRARLALLTSRSGSQLLEVVPQIFDKAAALLVPTPAVGVLSVW